MQTKTSPLHRNVCKLIYCNSNVWDLKHNHHAGSSVNLMCFEHISQF